MQSIFRSRHLASRTFRASPSSFRCPARFASQSYGNDQSGHQQASKDTPNPREDLEHPGRKSPAEEGKTFNSKSSQPQSSSSQNDSSTSDGSKPKIHSPSTPPENSTEEVEAHNKEMAERGDRTSNQLSEKDNKVDKNFWSGDVGPATGEKKK